MRRSGSKMGRPRASVGPPHMPKPHLVIATAHTPPQAKCGTYLFQERSSNPLAWRGVRAACGSSLPSMLTPSSCLWHSYGKQVRRLRSSSARVLSLKTCSFKPGNLSATPTLSTKGRTLVASPSPCVRRQKEASSERYSDFRPPT